jgi:drug/metabolite transporter (DMT)-like permease
MLFVVGTFSLMSVLASMILKRGSDPFCFACYRELGTAVLLGAACAFVPRPTLPSRRDALLLACGGVSVYFLQLFYILGIADTSADVAAIFQPVTPVLVVLLGTLTGIEPLVLCRGHPDTMRRSRLRLAGVAVAVAGCTLEVVSPQGGAAGATRVQGVIFLLLSDLSSAALLLSQKPIFARMRPLHIIATSYAVGALCMAVTAAALRGGTPAAWAVSPLEGAVLAFVVLICGAGNYSIMTWCNERLDATVLALYGILQPPVTAAISFALQGATVRTQDALGALLIIAGLVLASVCGQRENGARAGRGGKMAALLASEDAAMRADSAEPPPPSPPPSPPPLSVGTLVLIDGCRAGELACANDDGSWDCILDDGSDEDAVRPERITAAAAQRERVAPDSDLEAAAASLRLGLTLGPGDGEDGDLAADGHMCQVVVEEAMGGGSVWLGSGTAAKSRHWFDARGITAVLNVSRDIPNYFERDARFEYHSLRCDDTEGDAQAMGSQLEPALATLERWVGDGRHVLVHCHAGRSRSATVVLAFMMQRGVPLEEAIERVSARRAILPNWLLRAACGAAAAWLCGRRARRRPSGRELPRRTQPPLRAVADGSVRGGGGRAAAACGGGAGVAAAHAGGAAARER